MTTVYKNKINQSSVIGFNKELWNQQAETSQTSRLQELLSL
jgi:hypothetical protein